MKRIIFLIFISISIIATGQNNSRSVFNSNKGAESKWLLYKNNNQALYKIITNEALELLDAREQHIETLQNRQDWQNYTNFLKSNMFPPLNKFERASLNAKITGTLERDNFKVEKIVFESHPGFYVTAAMFIPKKRQKPAPTVIYCSGHTELGFRSEAYQRIIINLVEKGFIVFSFDPIGQGERSQYFDAQSKKSNIGGPTTEHSYAGAQTLLTGTSLTEYFIWDGVRALDYLETRKEVDMKRIGITGRSGGGTQSAMIAAYDDRIYAAAPECYITNYRRLLQSIGPQDAEQNPFRFIKNGFDHPDFIHVRVPKPTLIVTTTHDFFSQQGARETYAEVQKSYSAFGKPDNIQFTVDMGTHESTKNNRETVYAFFQKHLNLPGDKTDREIDPFSLEELWATSTGQVSTSHKGETVFSLNKKYYTKEELDEKELQEKIIELSGVQFQRKLKSAVFTGKFNTKNYEVEKYFLENNTNDYALPVYLIRNNGSSSGKTLIFLSSEGKISITENKQIDQYLKEGFNIISADLPGIGELADPEFKGDGFVKGVPFNYTFGAQLVGKSIPGIQAEAIDLLVQFVQQSFPSSIIEAATEGDLSTAMIIYASQKKELNKIHLHNALKFDEQFIETEYYNPADAYNIVPGSLSYFNFNDIISKVKNISIE